MNIEINNSGINDNFSLPIDGLSSCIQEIIQAYADGYQCERDFVVTSVFAAVSTAIRKKVHTDDGRYKNYMPFYICLVADSGVGKTTPMREILKPIIERDVSYRKAYQESMRKYQAEIDAGNKNAERPIRQALVIDDTTEEIRMKILSENPGVLLYSDELSTMLFNFNRYTRSGEVPRLLSIWNNHFSTVDRMTKDSLLAEEPFLSIIGGTQPGVVKGTFGGDFFVKSGFNHRWMFVYPDEKPPEMYHESSVSKTVSDTWSEFINRLLDFDFSSNGTDTLIIANEAKQVYINYFNELQLKSLSACEYMKSVYAKLKVMVQRLAGIVHILGNNPGISRILPEEMEYSVRCMDYFERCAEKVYKIATEGEKKPEAKPMGNEEMIARVYYANNPKSQQAFADAIGVSRPFVSKCLKKYERLRGYGLHDILNLDNEVDMKEKTVTT